MHDGAAALGAKLDGLRVQLVSKPIVPPYRDGTKCLVRDWCKSFLHVTPEVMGTPNGAPGLGPRTVVQPVYSSDGTYAPGMTQNIRAAAWMALRCQAAVWHFVFAPNKASSKVGRALRRLRGVPTVQTVASAPRSFAEPEQLLFGDVVVAQSTWTAERFSASFAELGKRPPAIEVILPPCPDVSRPGEEEQLRVRAEIEVLPDAPLFVYPGDLEFSAGADFVIEFAARLAEQHPGAVTALAYRDKTPKAAERARELQARTGGQHIRLCRNVSNVFALLAAARGVVFPVEDLYGKVDIPIILLESLALGVPVLALNRGPLADLQGAELLATEPDAWVVAAARLAGDEDWARAVVERGRAWVREHHDARRIAEKYERIYAQLIS